MSNIILTPGIRQNLLSLQNTASLMATTQNRLATGKKVNSALDNPVSFFMSQSLSDRSNDLSNLLDSIGQAQQTLQTANQGITSLTTLVNSLKSMATQARQSTTPAATYTNNITGNVAIGDDVSRSTGSVATTAATFSGMSDAVDSTYTINTATIDGAATAGDTFTLDDGNGGTFTFEKGTTATTPGNIMYTDAASLDTALTTAYGAKATDVSGTVTINNGGTSLAAVTDNASGALVADVTNTAASGDSLTLTVGSSTVTFKFKTTTPDASAGEFNDLASLKDAINQSSIGSATAAAGKITASDDGNGALILQSDSATSFTSSGTVATATGIGASALANDTLSGLAGILSIKVGTAAAQTIDFGTVHTKAALTTALSGLTGVTGGFNSSGNITLSSTTADTINISGTNTAASGLFGAANIGDNTPTGTYATPNATRTSLQANFNDLLTQIDQLAGELSYNGINLLNGDTLKVVFNENGTSFLNISGVNLNAAGLGLTALTGDEFQDNSQIDTVIGKLNNSLAQLRAQASAFGSTLTTVQTRQDFTKNLITTLQTGSDNLVLADTNEEGANLLALQTRQSLSTTALSLANQASQAVLRLFG